MRRLLPLVLVAAITAPAALGAQDARYSFPPPFVEVGSRVRVNVTDSASRSPVVVLPTREVVGIVRAITAETLYLHPAAPSRTPAVPRIMIQSVRISRGPPSRRVSARERGLIGAVLMGLVFSSKRLELDQQYGSSFNAVAAGAGIGLVAGATIGALWPHERWRYAWIPE